jgi:hypothetical protein
LSDLIHPKVATSGKDNMAEEEGGGWHELKGRSPVEAGGECGAEVGGTRGGLEGALAWRPIRIRGARLLGRLLRGGGGAGREKRAAAEAGEEGGEG